MMADEGGHFKEGIWITGESSGNEKDQQEQPGREPENLMEERIAGVSKNLTSNIDDIIHLARDLLTTESGHRHIEKLVDTAASRLERTISDLFVHTGYRETEEEESPEKSRNNDK
jgi:hypothetical protein